MRVVEGQICAHPDCDQEFRSIRSRQKFCSSECQKSNPRSHHYSGKPRPERSTLEGVLISEMTDGEGSQVYAVTGRGLDMMTYCWQTIEHDIKNVLLPGEGMWDRTRIIPAESARPDSEEMLAWA